MRALLLGNVDKLTGGYDVAGSTVAAVNTDCWGYASHLTASGTLAAPRVGQTEKPSTGFLATWNSNSPARSFRPVRARTLYGAVI